MNVVNEMLPASPERVKAMLEPGPEGPIFMVNLLKFKDRAEYEDGRESGLSGREAYAIYGRAVMEILPKFGGQVVFAGDVTFLALGQVEELWDEVAIAMYPERGAMVRMSMSPEWQTAAVHRTAGLKGQLNIETVMQADMLAGGLLARLTG
ncbi:DUF1330 domain-containing protein [Hyphomonas sp.]|uniref:DUF1330 domain-containing protein n=1 Tax=Hyphomonas sp. TaxID=87 RepID=UPI0039194D7B